MTERSEKADHRSASSYGNGKDARQCHCERTTTSRIPKQSHDLSRCTAFPLLYLIMYYCMLYHNRAKYTRGKFVCERCGNRAIGRRSKLGTRTSGGPLRLGSKHARASGGPFRPSAKDTRASAIPFRPGSKHFNQRTKMAQDFRVVRVSQTAAPPPTVSHFPHHISDLGVFTMLGRIDERHGDLPRHSAEQKPNNSKLSSENLAKVGRSKTARGKIANSGIGEARARVAGR